MTENVNHTAAVSPSPEGLAMRLKTETAALHESMHVLMGELAPFTSRDRYVRFVAAQFVFQSRVNALAGQSRVDAIIPDLPMRSRVGAARDDLRDLDDELTSRCRQWVGDAGIEAAALPADQDVTATRALGWLYVSEGSTLGAAFLFKEAQSALGLTADFGARNLAASPTGRAMAWRAFTASMDAADLSPDQQDEVVQGAHEAFRFFGTTLTEAFGDAPVNA